MPYVRSQGLRIHYHVEGHGPPLVCQHGFGDSLESWYELGYVDALKDEYRLILIDARGHGASGCPYHCQRPLLWLFDGWQERLRACRVGARTVALLERAWRYRCCASPCPPGVLDCLAQARTRSRCVALGHGGARVTSHAAAPRGE